MELLDNLAVAVLPECILKDLALLIDPFLSPFHRELIDSFSMLLFLIIFVSSHILGVTIVVLILGNYSLMHLKGLHLIEEALDDTSEEVVVLVETRQDAEKIVVGQQTLLQALVQEVVVSLHYIVDGLHVATIEELILQFQEVGLQNFYSHVVYVVLAKMKHSMSEGECMLLNS